MQCPHCSQASLTTMRPGANRSTVANSLRLLGKMSLSLAQYLRETLRRRSVFGLHWDRFRVQIISLLAQRATSLESA